MSDIPTSDRKIITIDGPAASGKSTTAREVARRLGWQYLDTGAMYRAFGLAMLKDGVDPEDEGSVCGHVDEHTIDITGGDPIKVFLDGEDVSAKIRESRAALAASKVATLQCVREKLVELQREIARRRPCVLEGRDTGTIVFPHAGLKIYLDAPAEQRAKRRLMEQGEVLNQTLEEMIVEVRERDERDKSRKVSPLTKAVDAITINTGPLSIDEQVEEVLRLARERFGDDL